MLQLGRALFVGLSSRTNAAGVQQLTELVGPLGYLVKPVRIRGALHLKTAATTLPDGRLLLNPNWLAADDFGVEDAIHVPADEPFGANTLSVGSTVLVQANAPRTASILDALGFATQAVDIAQFNLVEAGLTCLSVKY